MERAKEEAERVSRAKSEFLTTMSHELRTPLNGILGMNELLQSTALTPQQREYVEASTNSGRTLLSLINDIMDISKIEAGKIELEWSPHQLDRLIHETIAGFSIEAKKRKIELSCKLSPEMGSVVLCDGLRLKQILLNLIGNAFKFTSEGSILLEAERVGVENRSMTVRILIHDTGIGIPDDRVASIFSPFTQADQSTTRKYGGTGLGLSIAKQLTELMGGQIGVSSCLGAGSTFWVQIPFEVLDDSPTTVQVSEGWLRKDHSEPTFSGATRHILVAEDNKINQLYVMELLRLSGCTCDVVESGSDAISAIETARYDLVLMDCQMPETDGFTATREIRRREQKGELPGRVPIIALTANAVKGDRERCLDAGMDDYLSKPVEGHELNALLEKYLLK